MRRNRPPLLIRLAILIGLTLLVALVPASVSAGGATPTQWHRLNPGIDTPPEHERLTCVFGAVDACRYDKLPERDLGFQWNRTRGLFIGSESSESWTCPDWFPAEICGKAARVSTGSGTFFPQGEDRFTVGQDLIVTDDAGGPGLWVYWHDQFVCPWFTAFDDALAANPIPLPYDGEHAGEMDCVFAP